MLRVALADGRSFRAVLTVDRPSFVVAEQQRPIDVARSYLTLFEQGNPLWPPYMPRDTMRIADFYGIDYAWPEPDPIVQDYVTRKVAREQPYIFRLARLSAAVAGCVEESIG